MYVQLMLKDSPQLSGRTINYGVVVSAFPSASRTAKCSLQLKGQFHIGICITTTLSISSPLTFYLV